MALASELPVARVVLDVALPHLDKAFDYAVPNTLDEAAQPGVRCTVRLAGQRVSGFIVERLTASDHPALKPLLAVASAQPVLRPDVLRLARAVADAQAGVLSDVLRLAVPPRHATTEKSVLARQAEPVAAPARPDAQSWGRFRGGQAFLDRLAGGLAPRAVWTALPGDWPMAVAVAAGTTASAGRGSIVVVPDHGDVQQVLAALGELGLGALTARLSADQGAAARYRAFLEVLLGRKLIVVGTRAAAFAPVLNPGLLVCWDDGNDLLAEPRAPYPHARDVLRLRADQSGAAALIGGLSRSVDAQLLIESGWAREVAADRAVVRVSTPRVEAAGDDDLRDPAARSARLPLLALRVAREALQAGPVLVQVPHTGYVQTLACQRCRAPARCPRCEGPLAVGGRAGVATCRWCGWTVGATPGSATPGSATPGSATGAAWRCRHCGDGRLRAVRVGSARTGEEIGRALPGVPVRVSSSESGVLPEVGPEPTVVVATPGAEPLAAGGYGAALLLDGWVPLARPELEAGEQALRRWIAAAALVRPVGQGGRVVLVADSGASAVQALIRWDPAGFAARELAERAQLGLPPVGVLAGADGSGVPELLKALRPPEAVEVLGPTGTGDETRVLLRAPGAQRLAVARALAAARGVVSATKAATPPRVRMRTQA